MLTVPEAAARLGLSTSTLRHQIRNGKLRGQRHGPPGRTWWTVSEQEVERYRKEHKR